jgi:riboflavin kinase / FMN adenylyltransferase
MKVYKSPQEAHGKIKNAVVTTGSFDGVHIGHKSIINRLNKLAANIHGESCLVTFYPHPRKVLYPEQKDLKLINSQEEKIELLSKSGLNNLVIIPFSKEFSQTTSHDFITDILIGQLQAKIIIVGHNHHFGHNRSGDFSYLHELSRELNFLVEDIPLLDIENEIVSSTKIRKAIAGGNIMRANAYLDHQYIIMGRFVNAGRTIHFNGSRFFEVGITENEKLVPPPGVYATIIKTGVKCLKTMTLIFGDDEQRQVYNTLIYDHDDLHNKTGTVYFYKKIKGGEIFFDNEPDQDELTDAKNDIDELIY